MSNISFEKKLTALINEYNKDNELSTPDFILAKYLCSCLELFKKTLNERDKWEEDSWDNIP
jgi:uncharacterized Fe-S cluster-containing MiaB family protein